METVTRQRADATDGGTAQVLLVLAVAVGLTCVGLVFLAYGIRRHRRSRAWPRTTGTVTTSGLSVSGMGVERGGTITPTVRYVTAAGRTVEVRSSASDNMTRYSRGRELPVRYDPAVPERMVIDRFGQNGVAHALVGAFVVLFGVTGLIAVVSVR